MSNYDDYDYNNEEMTDDFYDDYEEESYREKEKRAAKRRKDDRKHKRKAREIWESGDSYYGGYYPVDKHGNYADEEDDIAYFKRADTGKRSSFLKKQSNKKIRHEDSDEALKGGEYKKKYDYKWELY